MIRTKSSKRNIKAFNSAIPTIKKKSKLSTNFINDNLSCSAIGMLMKLFTESLGDSTNPNNIRNFLIEGYTKYRTICSELEKKGYLLRIRYNNSPAVCAGSTWFFTDSAFCFDADSIKELIIGNGFLLPIKERKILRTLDELWGLRKPESEDMIIILKYNHISIKGFIKKNKEKKILNDIYTFDQFWDDYGKKMGGKDRPERTFNRLSDKDKLNLKKSLPKWIEKVAPNKKFRPYPSTFLNNRRWEDDLEDLGDIEPKNNYPQKNNKRTNDPIEWLKGAANKAHVAPKQLIQVYNSVFGDELKDRVSITNDNQLAHKIVELIETIKSNRPKNVYNVTAHSQSIGTPVGLVGEFIWWLQKESWIKNINENTFNFESKLFARFLKDRSTEIGVNVITGRLN